ncbi:MAG: toll/interleukin-1 receptor domain-containing protein [Gammaproteobacteria bacterium]
MSDIFLSYASEDTAHAGRLAQALARRGWSVWWDRSILPGKVFDAVIEAELAAAKCVIVLWTGHSVASRWVRAEAGEALDKGRLIPVLLEEVAIPLVFRQVQAATLIGWDGGDDHPGYQHLLKAVGAVVAAGASAAPPAADAGAQSGGRPSPAVTGNDVPDRRRVWWGLLALGVVAVAGTTAYVLRDEPVRGVTVGDDEAWRYRQPYVIAARPAEPPAAVDKAETAAPAADTAPAPPADPVQVARAAPAPGPPRDARMAVRRDALVAAAKPAQPIAESAPEPAPKPAPEPVTETVAKTEPALPPAAPLKVLAVAWAMPSDDGTASDTRVREYSQQLARMMTAVVDELVAAPLRFDYHYPDQQAYYRLLKDRDDHAQSRSLCTANDADLIVAGFVKGAEFVSISFGYALTRDPVFSVYDCRTRRKIEKSYQVAERVGDRFPYEQATTAVFRRFAQQEAALDGR